MSYFRIIAIALLPLLSSCSNNIHQSRFDGNELNEQAVKMLIQDVVKSVKNWRKGIVQKLCVPGPETGLYQEVFDIVENVKEFEIVEYKFDAEDEYFNGNQEVGIRRAVDIFLRDNNNKHKVYGMYILTLNGQCVSYAIDEMIEN
jgi:hypothetical protein